MVVLNLHDVVFVNCSEFSQAIKKLGQVLGDRGYNGTSYRSADAQLPKYVLGEKTRDEVLDHCSTLSQKNSVINREVLELSTEYFQNKSIKYADRIKQKYWYLRQDIPVRCAIPFYYVDSDNRLIFFWVQNRKYDFLLDDYGLMLQASVIADVYARDDFAGASVEVMDLSFSKIHKARIRRVRHFEQHELLPSELLLSRFDTFLQTYDLTQLQSTGSSGVKPKTL